jgi:uncharacterized membrane protein
VPDYNHTIAVDCDADQVFAFVSDPENMPRYLPTVHHAHPQGEERVEVEGEAAGHPYHSDGWLKLDQGAKRMAWGSDGENQYRGELEVVEDGGKSLITVTLHFQPRPDQQAQFAQQAGRPNAAIDEGIRKALESIRNHCETPGAKTPTKESGGYVG